MNIIAGYEYLKAESIRNLAAALIEMPQLLVLQVVLYANDIRNEGAARVAQALSTLTNLIHLSLDL